MLTIGSLFSGIGGLELGLEWAGLGPVVWQCENDPFCREVLERHWPGVERFKDVARLTNPPAVDLVCGGFPCQDVSSAGKGAGLAGRRSGLWYQFARVVGEVRPPWVVVENVASGASRWVDAVVYGLWALGYETLPPAVSAEDVGAPHIRERIFVVAHAVGEQLRQQPGRGCRPDREDPALAGEDGGDGDASDPVQKRCDRGSSIPEATGERGRVLAEGIDPAQAATNTASDHSGARSGEPEDRRQKGPDAQGCGDGHPHRDGEPAQPEHEQVAGLRGLARDPSPWATAPEFRRVDDGAPRRVDRLRSLGNAVVPQCAEVIGWAIRELMGSAT